MPDIRIGEEYHGHQLIGQAELRLDGTINRRTVKLLRQGLIERAGVYSPQAWPGCMDRAWSVAQVSGGEITVRSERAGLRPFGQPGELWGITQNGDVFEYEPPAANAVVAESPADSTWRTLIVRPVIVLDEPGTVEVTSGSATFIGTNTRWTDTMIGKTTDGGPRGTKIELRATDVSNAKEYEVDTVVSDTELTVTAASLPGADEAEIVHFVKARYSTSATSPDYERTQRLGVEFELVDRETVPSSPDDFYLADVWYDGATMKFIDRRAYNLVTFSDFQQGRMTVGLAPEVYFDTAAPYLAAGSSVRTLRVATAGDITEIAMCRGAQGAIVAAVFNGTSVFFDSFNPSSETWANVATIVTAAITGLSLIQLPSATGYTHACFYTLAGVCYVRRTSDDGVTWTTASVVWDPTGTPGDLALEPAAIHLLNGRILVLMSYYDSGAGKYKLIYVFSDDYCVSWDDNSGAGYTWVNSSFMGTDYDARRPAIHQADNGEIFTAWQVNTTGATTYSIRCAFSEYDYKLDTVGLRFGLNFGTLITTDGTSQTTPVVWNDRDGNGIVIYGVWVSGSRNDIKWTGIQHQWDSLLNTFQTIVTTTRRLIVVTRAGTAVTVTPNALALTEGFNGTLRLAYRNWADGGIDDAWDLTINLVASPTNLRWER